MADLRRMFYNRYKSSNIFNREMPQLNPIINKNTAREINKKKDTFIPKYNKMTSKERYWHEMRYKEFGHSNNENKDMNNIDTKSNKNSSKQFKRNHSIKDSRRRSEYEKQNNLNGVDIMCKHMFNGYDPKKYKMKRSKSLYDLRSYSSDLPINEKSSRQERNLAYTGSNIFFDKSKDLQIKQSYNKFKKNKSSTNLNDILSKSFKRQKSMSDFERELNERKSKFSHSKYTTDMDWKTTNTEDMHYDSESDYASVFSDNGVKKKSFRRVNILKREITGDVNNKNKNREQVKESVKYNILTGKDKKDAISDKIYNKYDNNNNNKLKKNYSKKKYDYKTNNNNDKYQTNIEYYEIDIPRNYDLTDINTIRNYFTNKGLHAFKIEESANTYTNQSGKITLRIRRDNVIDDKEYNKNINSVKNLMSKKDMKLYKVEGNKAKASVIAKNRVKTPFKGELMLKPCDTKGKKNNYISKKCSVDIKGTTKKRNNKTPGKKNNKNNTKTKK
jgi:hypothetical protein